MTFQLRGSWQHASVRRVSVELDMKWLSLQRILQANKWHSYIMQIIQILSENDKSVRKSFAEMEILHIRTNENHLSFLTFSDEAHFHLDGRFNRHTFRYWSQKKPRLGR